MDAMNKLYGLIFDVDGVIADTEAVNATASIKVFADLFDIEGVVREDFEAGLGRGAEEYVKTAAQVHGLELTDKQVEQATQLRQEYFLKILSEEPLPPFPGVLDLMNEAMQGEDFSVAIATSGTLEKSRAVLNAVGVPYRKMVYINGNDVKHKKPDPELFLIAGHRGRPERRAGRKGRRCQMYRRHEFHHGRKTRRSRHGVRFTGTNQHRDNSKAF